MNLKLNTSLDADIDADLAHAQSGGGALGGRNTLVTPAEVLAKHALQTGTTTTDSIHLSLIFYLTITDSIPHRRPHPHSHSHSNILRYAASPFAQGDVWRWINSTER